MTSSVLELQLKAGEAVAKGQKDSHFLDAASRFAAQANSFGCVVEVLDSVVKEVGEGEDPELDLNIVTVNIR